MNFSNEMEKEHPHDILGTWQIRIKWGVGIQIWRHYLGGSTKSDFVWQGGRGGLKSSKKTWRNLWTAPNRLFVFLDDQGFLCKTKFKSMLLWRHFLNKSDFVYSKRFKKICKNTTDIICKSAFSIIQISGFQGSIPVNPTWNII